MLLKKMGLYIAVPRIAKVTNERKRQSGCDDPLDGKRLPPRFRIRTRRYYFTFISGRRGFCIDCVMDLVAIDRAGHPSTMLSRFLTEEAFDLLGISQKFTTLVCAKDQVDNRRLVVCGIQNNLVFHFCPPSPRFDALNECFLWVSSAK